MNTIRIDLFKYSLTDTHARASKISKMDNELNTVHGNTLALKMHKSATTKAIDYFRKFLFKNHFEYQTFEIHHKNLQRLMALRAIKQS